MATGAESPGPYVRQIFALLDKRQGFAFTTARARRRSTGGVRRASIPISRGATNSSCCLGGGLVTLDLPSRKPADTLDFMKPKGGDIFRVVRADGSEADPVRFLRDAKGRVTGIERFGNRSHRVGDVSAVKLR